MLFTVLSLDSIASEQRGMISEIRVRSSDGLHYFYMTGEQTSREGTCAAGQAYWMIRDEKSVYGKNQFAMLMMAYAAGRTVLVKGTGSCKRWKDGEDVNYIVLM
ncbi:hypothetical protein A3759_17805 [Thalassolituus sp. HI0120]|nr:hypothetical protein A3759_22940 [Thalassolituus sp. HI0120]KZZ48826.1 hypothetical protein A3759_17805 [Thalassolituus sp. HI0120]